jgi:hypothetical protein
MTPSRIATVLRDHLQDISTGGFPIAGEPILVPRVAYLDLLAATRRLLEILRSAVVKLATTSDGRMKKLGADPRAFERFVADHAFEIEHSVDFARADVIFTQRGPQFIEFNVGGGIGGMVEFELQRGAWTQLRRESGLDDLFGASLYDQFAKVINRTADKCGLPRSATLIGTADDAGKNHRHFDAQVEFLEQRGISARFVELSKFAEELDTVGNITNSVAVVQFTEYEARLNGWDVMPFLGAVRAGLVAVPSQTSRLIDSKKVLALVSEGLPWMSEEDRRFVDRYVPWSRILAGRRVEWRGRSHDMVELLIRHKDSFVLKGAAGLSAREVHFGASHTEDEWHKMIEEFLITEYYTVQEVVDPLPHQVRVLNDDDGSMTTIRANSIISPFCIGGVPAGCHVRFAAASDEPRAITRGSGGMQGCLLGEPE